MKKTLLLFIAFNFSLFSFAQSGAIDLTFNPTDTGFDNGANNRVLASELQPDGKIIIGGYFTNFKGTSRNYVVRLNIDGSLDESFNLGIGVNDAVMKIRLQSNGKILIGGDFTNFNGVSRNRILRLNTDGSLDTSFNIGIGANGIVETMIIQQDGKIIVGGNFTLFNGISQNRIVRLNEDGSLDNSFNVGNGANEVVREIQIQTDGKIIVGGFFTSFNTSSIGGIVRLNVDGSLDTNFNVGIGANNIVTSAILQTDGKIIIGGNFTSLNGTPQNRIARLNADGSLDTTFNPGSGANNFVETTLLLPDGKIIIGGYLTNYNGIIQSGIARLNSDGSLDSSFNIGSGADSTVSVSQLQPDGKIIIGGDFFNFNNRTQNRITRLNADGSLDTSFNIFTGADSVIYHTQIQADEKIIIGGTFTSFNGTTKNRIARLNSDGSLDTGFDSGSGANASVKAIKLQLDGKIIIGGYFTSFNGTPKNRIVRLNSDGSLDIGFNSGSGANGTINKIELQLDGKTVIGGNFTSFNGILVNRIARLNIDGSLDSSFNPGLGPNNTVSAMQLQPDGKIIIGGYFTSYDGTSKNSIARLNSDGSLDASFNSGLGANNGVQTAQVQTDGKIIIGGAFTSFNGSLANRIARLNMDGSLDVGFNSGTGFDNNVLTTQIQPDGKIIIGGYFAVFNGVSKNNITRLNNDGSLDSSFNTGIGTNDIIYTTQFQSNGKIIIGGYFTGYDGVGRNRIVRINAYTVPLSISTVFFDSKNVIAYKKNNILFINTENNNMDSIRIFDINGRLLLEKADINSSEISISNLAINKQLIIIQITDSEKRLINKKILF